MKVSTLSTYSQIQPSLHIVNDMEVTLTITENVLNIPLEKMFKMAARINKKRGFLFVSELLGKHIPVHPYKPLLTSGLLAIEYYEKKTGNTTHAKQELVDGLLSEDSRKLEKAYSLLQEQKLSVQEEPTIIAFAETATALGHAVFDCLEPAYFIATTREQISEEDPSLIFEEEHSHAVDQCCYLSINRLEKDNPIILVDDEITTGNTALNIIREIHSKYPRKEYTILSILDWRSKEHIEQFKQVEKELNITISTISLLSGTVDFSGKLLEEAIENEQIDLQNKEMRVEYTSLSHLFTTLPLTSCTNEYEHTIFPYVRETGRFGLTHVERLKINEACLLAGKQLSASRIGERTLCLGTGEFMYLPMKISTYMGTGISYHSTTRSPIHPVDREDYGIKNGFRFPNPEDEAIIHHVYNIPKGLYDEVFLFHEGQVLEKKLQPLVDIFKDRGISSVHVITLAN